MWIHVSLSRSCRISASRLHSCIGPKSKPNISPLSRCALLYITCSQTGISARSATWQSEAVHQSQQFRGLCKVDDLDCERRSLRCLVRSDPPLRRRSQRLRLLELEPRLRPELDWQGHRRHSLYWNCKNLSSKVRQSDST